MLRWKRKVIAVKPEGTYGVDSVPTAAANAFLVRNLTIRPLEMEYEERIVDTGYSGHLGDIVAGQFVGIDFEVELAGSGVLGTPPAYAPILKGAACGETINAGVSVVYAPVHPAAAVSNSVYFWVDGVLYKALGYLNNVALMFQKGRVPFMRVSGMGLYAGPVDQAVPTPTLTGFIKPVAVNVTNTTPATLHGYAGKFAELSLDFGNVLRYRNLPNSEAVRLLDRKSVGSVRLEGELIATKDWYTIMKAMTLGALSVQHGPATSQILLAGAQVQLTRPAKSVEDELVMKTMSMIFQPSSAGNDEWSITVR
jgi:hypothetical protein